VDRYYPTLHRESSKAACYRIDASGGGLIDWAVVLAMRLSAEASEAVTRLAREIPDVREERKAFALILDTLASLFNCTNGALFLHRRRSDTLYKVRSVKDAESLDMKTVIAFYRNEKPDLEEDTIMAPVRVGGEVAGVVALTRDAGFERGAGKIATEILRIAGKLVGGRRHAAVLEAETGIAGAILKGVAPTDVIYRVFHVLRRFIDYDLGATLLGRVDDNTCRVVARQVAWTEGKSDIVGLTASFPWQELPREQHGFVVPADTMMLREALCPIKEEALPDRLSTMLGPLGHHEHPIGCVEVSSRRANFFVDKDTHILSRFLPYLCWCLAELA
jgi:hypothetical protein